MARRDRLTIVAQVADAPPAEAEALLRKHLRKQPRDLVALTALADVLAPQSRLGEIGPALATAAMTPRATVALIEHACGAAYALNEPEAALRIATKGTQLHAECAQIWHQRGKAEIETADAPSAANSLERAHELAPNDTAILAMLADADLSRGAFPLPDKYARLLLDIEPMVATHHVRLGTSQRFNNHLDEAEACFRRAIELDSNLPSAYAGLAETLESKGDSESAAAELSPIIKTGSASFAVVSAWARVQQRLGDLPAAIAAMERYLASKRGGLPQQCNVLMRLGRAYEQAGRYDDAFRCWTQGNRVHQGRWNPDLREQFVDRMISTLSRERLAELPRASAAPFTPILVVGMYRSGTTLTEQILSAHPDVVPAGESPAMPLAVKDLAQDAGPLEKFPDTLGDVTKEQLERARDTYVGEMRQHTDTTNYLVDKLPMNYLNVGVASLTLPNARVLHIVRDPLDTAISCYSQSFTSRMAFTADLKHLGRTITQERRVMDHWYEACDLPMLKIQYETLVTEPEVTLQAVLEFLGLEWNEAVLNSHKSKRVAATPSMDQVRKPLNTSAIGRAAHFEAHIGPLRDALNM
jgi:tetratricopeptide (TPR) repeat protein